MLCGRRQWETLSKGTNGDVRVADEMGRRDDRLMQMACILFDNYALKEMLKVSIIEYVVMLTLPPPPPGP